MFGTLAHPTPMAVFLWIVWVVAQWVIAPPVSWMRPGHAAVPAGSDVEAPAAGPH